MGASYLWGWCKDPEGWVKVLVNSEGKLIIDPTEIFTDTPADGETDKAPTSGWAYNEAAARAAADAAHTEADTGVHGVGESTVCSETEAADLITAHADLPNAHHTPLWTLAETLSPDAVTSIDSSALAAHDLWMVILDLWGYAASAAEEQVWVNFNDDEGNNYGYRHIDNISIVVSSGQRQTIIGTMRSDNSYRLKAVGQLLINGKSGGTSGDVLGIAGMFSGGTYAYVNYNSFVNGYWKCGVADIAKMSFGFGCDTTGKIKIYYMDY